MQVRLLFAECEEFVRSQNDEQPIATTVMSTTLPVMSTNVETSLCRLTTATASTLATPSLYRSRQRFGLVW